MSTQQTLAPPAPAPSNTVVINARCSLRIEADRRVIVIAGLPVHHYRAEDAVAEVYAMVFLVESGFAQQTDVARAFERSVRTIRRYRERYGDGGMAALGREEGWRIKAPLLAAKQDADVSEDQRFCKPKIGSSILSTGTKQNQTLTSGKEVKSRNASQQMHSGKHLGRTRAVSSGCARRSRCRSTPSR